MRLLHKSEEVGILSPEKIKRMKFMLLIIPLLVLILLDLYVFWDQVDVEKQPFLMLLVDLLK